MEKSKKVLFVIVIVLAMFLIGVLGFKIAQNKYKPNDVINITVWRNGTTMTVKLVLGEETPVTG